MSYLDKVTVGSTTYDIQDSKAQADVNDLKSAFVSSQLITTTDVNGRIVQGYWAFSSGASDESTSGYIKSNGYVNKYKSISIDQSYGIMIGLLAYESGTFKGTWNHTSSTWEKAGYKSDYVGYSYDIEEFKKSYPTYDFVITLRYIESASITPQTVDGKLTFTYYDNAENTIDDTERIIGNYKRYDYQLLSLQTGIGVYWNNIVNVSIQAGQKLDIEFLSYSGTKLSGCYFGYIDGSNNYHTIKSNLSLNSKTTVTIPVDVTKLYFQFRRSEAEYNVTGSVYMAYNNNHVYHCENDGSGDFNNLVKAINAACNFMDSTIYVGAGTWDLISELGNTYVESVSSTQRGVYLKNRVHLIGSSEAKITCNYTGSTADTIQWLSAFNAGEYGFTLENIIIESSNCRYAIHDERDTNTDPYVNKYINCKITHNNENGGNAACIGGGLGKDGHIIIDGCVFANPNVSNTSIVSYHNTWYNDGTGKSFVEVKGCYFRGTTGLRFSWFGASQEITTFLVHDNSLGKSIAHVVENQEMMDAHPEWIQNTELLSWNNEVRSN